MLFKEAVGLPNIQKPAIRDSSECRPAAFSKRTMVRDELVQGAGALDPTGGDSESGGRVGATGRAYPVRVFEDVHQNCH